MRLPVLVALVPLLSFLIAACGGGGGEASTKAATAAPTAAARDGIVIRALGIDAPLTLKRLGAGPLPSPDGAEDVALYDFGVAGLGGAPGGGNVVMAGRSLSEVACNGGREQPPCEGAFFKLAAIPVGERIDVTWKGVSYRYQVVAVCNVAARDFGDGLYRRTSTEQLTLLTGTGELGQTGFSHLLVVIARRAPVTSGEACPAGTNTGPKP
jgi:hypothetical protein